MSSFAGTIIAALAALAAACSFGVGVALQHRQAQLAPMGGRAPFRLLAHLARQRLWLAGITLNVAAYGLQALALAFGPLALVAPIAATDLLFALPLAARWSRRPIRPAGWIGCMLVGGGVAVFLVAAPPSAGRSDAPIQDWALAFAAVALTAGAAISAARLTRGPARAGVLALAGGTVFGLTSALTLSVTGLLATQGLGHLLGHWQLWALVALGAVGLLLSASIFRAGALSASVPVIDTAEPISAVLIGTVVFGEHLAASPPELALQLAGAAAAAVGVIVLGRSPLTAPATPGPAEHAVRAGAAALRGMTARHATGPGPGTV